MVNQLTKEIMGMSGEYSWYEIFSDWVKAGAISISNSTDMDHGAVWKKRESEYMDIARRHGAGRMETFARMLGMLAEALESGMEDVLGRVYMESGLGSRSTGQFFTPFHLSYMAASLGVPENISEDMPYIMDEPSSGGGGMVIAAARVLGERGLDYQRCMRVTAQDLDWKGVYMTYVQLSLLGIRAAVVQGDSLGASPADIILHNPERVLYTPAWKGALAWT